MHHKENEFEIAKIKQNILAQLEKYGIMSDLQKRAAMIYMNEI